MGHGKETPRQKMVGMMYLFLTALMALNVSKDVLNSFIQVSESLENTINNYKHKNEKVYNEFRTQYMQNPDKVGPWKKHADLVEEESKKVFELLEHHKLGLLEYAEGPESPALVDGKVVPKLLQGIDNIDKGGEYFIGLEGGKNGLEIRAALNHLTEELLHIIPEEEEQLRHSIEHTLETHDHPPTDKEEGHSWESYTFAHIPIIADFVALSTLQTNVKNVETDVINYLLSQISAGDFKVNKMEGMAIAPSNYVIRGNEYTASVFVAAYDSTQDPTIYVGEYRKKGVESYEMVGAYDSLEIVNGKGIFSKVASSLGDQVLQGLIKIKNPDQGVSYFPFKANYTVAEPNVVVSPTKMNVFYYGIDNPVDISVPGIAPDKIKPQISGASVRQDRKGGYVVKPSKQSGEVTVNVMAEIDGQMRSMGKKTFRIKTIPKPVPTVMGQNSGKMSRAMLSNANGVVASLGKDFVFDLSFRVTQFTVTATVGGFTNEETVKGNKFNAKQKNMIKNLKAGSNLIIENIEAVGPDGRTQPLSPIVFKIK